MQYLVKPISLDTFCDTLDMAIDSIEPAQSMSYPINSVNGTIKVHFASISYIECQKHTLFFHLADGNDIVSRSIRVPFEEAIPELLADPRFIRIHQSYVVNLSYVTKLVNQSFELETSVKHITLPISKNKYPEVKKAYLEAAN